MICNQNFVFGHFNLNKKNSKKNYRYADVVSRLKVYNQLITLKSQVEYGFSYTSINLMAPTKSIRAN